MVLIRPLREIMVSGRMGKVIVLDPSVARQADHTGPGPDFGNLEPDILKLTHILHFECSFCILTM